MREVEVIGGGLAGCEAAWQLARLGVTVRLLEMRPLTTTPAHRTAGLAELVCSNSLKASGPDRPHGLLKEELRLLGSLLLAAAEEAAIGGGRSLVVDRGTFSAAVGSRIVSHPLIRVEREEAAALPSGPAVVATGPLTSPPFARAMEERLGAGSLAFYDAIAPTVEAESIDWEKVFVRDRYGPPGEGSYVNCPLTREEYQRLVAALREGATVPPHLFEEEKVFEACLPVEVLAARGERTLSFGPLRPVGLEDPRTGRRPFAVVQLRPENRERTLFGMVGFQTKLTPCEQERVFRLIPGLARASFERMGSIHRNTYLDAPRVLDPWMRARAAPHLFFAGQITGLEGYVESIAGGLLAGLFAARFLRGETPPLPPPETMTGALLRHLSHAPPGGFTPANAQMGLLPALPDPPRGREERRKALAERALTAMRLYAGQVLAGL